MSKGKKKKTDFQVTTIIMQMKRAITLSIKQKLNFVNLQKLFLETLEISVKQNNATKPFDLFIKIKSDK